jgi:pyridoxal phosphate enzyme (YggS family)
MHLEAVRARIAQAAARAGRDPSEVSIVAVTKTHPVAAVREAVQAGLLDIGENRVQEALAKQEAWPEAPVRWHLIGHLQRNKAKQAVGRFALIHSLDSVRLADALEHAAAAAGVVQHVLVQVNVAREPQKDGVPPDEAESLVRHVESLAHLSLKGLMTMAPFTDDVSVQRTTFRGLRELRDRLVDSRQSTVNSRPPIELSTVDCRLSTLSMGMSGDFEVAVEEGATMLRLGTVLFGERKP